MNFDKISIILVDTQLPENVGLVARSSTNLVSQFKTGIT